MSDASPASGRPAPAGAPRSRGRGAGDALVTGRTRRAAAAVALALALAACGAEPPEAPTAYSMKITSAAGEISDACGEAYEVTAFGTDRRELATLEAKASSAAHTLALVDRRDPNWIHLGQTVRRIVSDSAALLESCGLHRARARLLRETTHR